MLHCSLALPGNAALAVVSRFGAPIAKFDADSVLDPVLDSAARQFVARAREPALGDAAS